LWKLRFGKFDKFISKNNPLLIISCGLFSANILKLVQNIVCEGQVMKDNKSVAKSLTMISQVGISMLVPIFLCCMLGLLLENKLGWPVFIPLFILGALAGMRNVYVMISAIYKEDDKKKK
jgi:hypothetical protein